MPTANQIKYLAVITIMLMLSFVAVLGVYPSDDNLYLIYNSIRLQNEELARSNFLSLIEVLQLNGEPYFYANRGVFRFELREEYSDNYIFVSWLQSNFYNTVEITKAFDKSISLNYISSLIFCFITTITIYQCTIFFTICHDPICYTTYACRDLIIIVHL